MLRAVLEPLKHEADGDVAEKELAAAGVAMLNEEEIAEASK
jgi:hypothetical protein